MEAFTGDGALLVDTYGLRLLRYVTATNEGDLTLRLSGTKKLPEPSEDVLLPLEHIARQAAAAAGSKAAPVRFHLDVLGQFQPSLGTSLGTALRTQAGGDVAIDVPDDPLTGALVLMLRDVFPLMLLPDDPWMPGHVRVTGATFRHPQREVFESAVAAEPELAALFPPTLSGSERRGPFIYRSTGSGGTTQLELLPELLLGAAWTRAVLTNREDLPAVAEELGAVVSIIRRAARNEAISVPVFIAFTGVLPEGIDHIDLPYGVLRPVASHERSFAPGAIEGSLSHTIADGDTVVVSYSGDLLLETSLPYRLLAVEIRDDAMPEWPPNMRGFDDVQSNVDTTRLAALLAGSPEAPLHIVPTWRLTLDPLNFGPMIGWSDPRTLPGLAPRRLSRTVADTVAKLARSISQQRRADFDVAIRRTLSGMTSRGDPGDALVDLVIGWENLFGSETELSFRISAAIAWILGADAAERGKLQKQCAKIYGDRSRIVHGSTLAPERIQRCLTEARDITLRLLRALFADRSDVLALTTGDRRSKAAIMGNATPE
jgi:Apea-like HEPN